MNKSLSQSFCIATLMLFTTSSIAFADALQDMARGDQAMKGEDIQEAAKYYRLAAEQNYAPAQVAMGELMHSTLENEEAVGWFLMAAYNGDPAGSYDLGQMYVVGEGVEPNPEKALYWIKLAAEKNYIPAIEVMVNAYQKGDLGLPLDIEQAKIWEAKLPPLKAVENKKINDRLAAAVAAQKAANEAALKKAAEKKAAEKKFNDEAAVKKVDAEDEAIAKRSSEKIEVPKK